MTGGGGKRAASSAAAEGVREGVFLLDGGRREELDVEAEGARGAAADVGDGLTAREEERVRVRGLEGSGAGSTAPEDATGGAYSGMNGVDEVTVFGGRDGGGKRSLCLGASW